MDAIAEVVDPDFEDELLGAIVPPWPAAQPTGDIQPLPAAASFADLLRYIQQRGQTAHPLASMAWKRTTLLGHLRALRTLATTDASVRQMPMVSGILEHVDARRRTKKWCWSTTLRALAELAGALSNLPVSHGIPAIPLSESAEWIAAIRGVAGRAKSERPRVPIGANADQIFAALQAEPRRHVKLLLALTWLCCGRTGDCRQLKPDDLILAEDGTLTVTFHRGKTISKRGPYSLHTRIPPSWLEELGISGQDVSWASTLCKAEVQDVLVALRRVAPALENRSIRRGSLQALAIAGVPEETLLLFSGHTQIATLRRYLSWGSIGTHKKTAMTTAAAALAPQGGAEHNVYQHNPYSLPAAPPSYTYSTRSGRDAGSSERWIQFLGAEAPPLAALPLATPKGDPSTLPLSSKPVAGTINIHTVSQLVGSTAPADPNLATWHAAIDPELRTLTGGALRWLTSTAPYEHLLRDNARHGGRTRRSAVCGLSKEHFEIQQTLFKYETAERLSELRREIAIWTRIFTVPEWHKAPPRLRHIAEPLLNDLFVATPTIVFRTRQEKQNEIKEFRGGYALTLDLASFFDQIPLADCVRKYFGIRFVDGPETWVTRMAVLPMGFRPSAQIAQTITWILCAGLSQFGPDGTKRSELLTYIDNILILARSPSDALRIRATILHRARLIGAVFNAEGLDDDPSQHFEFLGEAFDLSGEVVSVSLSEKTKSKLNALDLDVTGVPWSLRQLAAVIGLAMFASGAGLHRNDLYKRYHTLRFYRECASTGEWDKPTPFMPPHVQQDLRAWIAELCADVPRMLADEIERPPSDILFVDASAYGWGAVHVRKDGTLHTAAEPWTPRDYQTWNLESSVSAEPLAIARALCRCITPNSEGVCIYTDHEPVVKALRTSCARTYTYWVLQNALRSVATPCVLRHIAGSLNPADGFSRGRLDADWSEVLGEALAHHQACDRLPHHPTSTPTGDGKEKGTQPPEWAATARNPVRALCRLSVRS